jgi:DNA primase large subunit
MQLLHRTLRLEHHLKFAGRQQFGLFLKSIGLALEEALVFWRTAFAGKYSADAFAKEYAYNIRHNYGQEGKRANYTSFSCAKICSGAAGEQGSSCPYKHFSADRLAAALESFTGPAGKLNAPQIREVVTLAGEGHSQVACTRVFEFTKQQNKSPPGAATAIETITYPHKYYEQHLGSK